MTSQEFFEKFNAYAFAAKGLLVEVGDFKIRRGMAHSVSGYTEDLFAVFIAEKINRKDLQFLVDKVISVRLGGSNKAKSFKPDLAIIDNNVLTHYFDMKTNLGWNRAFDGYLHEKNEFMRQLKGSHPWINFSKEPDQHLTVAESCIYQMVVVYGSNINLDLLAHNLEQAKKYEYVRVHILCPRNAANEYLIDESAFQAIESTLPSMEDALAELKKA